jgi:hypothetical protein
VTGTFRFLETESAEPVTAQVMKTSEAITTALPVDSCRHGS